jgi:hypothetical protein
MRIHSTAASIEAGEVTWLAIGECILATVAYLVVAYRLRTFHYYALAIALAPLALLRTDAASRWALERYRHVNANGMRLFLQWQYHRRNILIEIARALFVFVVIFAWGFIGRTVGVIYWAIRQPVSALKQMPGNWVRQALCVDSYAPPEIVPGEDADHWNFEVDRSGERRHFSIPSTMLTFRRVFLPSSLPLTRYEIPKIPGSKANLRKWTHRLLDIAVGIALFAPVYCFPALYRVSVKATCVVYAPFVWVAGATASWTDTFNARLRRIVKGEFEKSRRRFAYTVLGLAVAKLAFTLGWIDGKEAAHKLWALIGSVKLATEFLDSKGWPLWQWAFISDAAITILLFWIGDAILSRMDDKESYQPVWVADAFAVVAFARAAIAVLLICYPLVLIIGRLARV